MSDPISKATYAPTPTTANATGEKSTTHTSVPKPNDAYNVSSFFTYIVSLPPSTVTAHRFSDEARAYTLR